MWFLATYRLISLCLVPLTATLVWYAHVILANHNKGLDYTHITVSQWYALLVVLAAFTLAWLRYVFLLTNKNDIVTS